MPAGSLLGVLFRQLFRAFLGDTSTKIAFGVASNYHQPIMAQTYFLSTSFSSKILTHFATGSLSLYSQNKNYFVAKDLLNIPSTIAQTRLVSLSLTKESKTKQPRLLHYASSFGFICPSTTSDGQSTGISNSMTVFCQMSTTQDHELLTTVLKHLMQSMISPDGFVIYINGQYFGKTTFPVKFVNKIRQYRRSHLIAKDISVYFNDKTNVVLMRQTAGRFLKPCFVIENMTQSI